MNNEIAIVFTTRRLEESNSLFYKCKSYYANSDEFYNYFTNWDVNVAHDDKGVPDEKHISENKKRIIELRTFLTQTIYANELNAKWDNIIKYMSQKKLVLDIEGLSRKNSLVKFEAMHHGILLKEAQLKELMLDYIKTENKLKKNIADELSSSPRTVIEKLAEYDELDSQKDLDINIDCKRVDLEHKLIQLRFKVYELLNENDYYIMGLWGLGDVSNNKEKWYEAIEAEVLRNHPQCKTIILILHDKDIQNTDCSFNIVVRNRVSRNGTTMSIAIFNHEDRIGKLLLSNTKTTKEVGDYVLGLFKNN